MTKRIYVGNLSADTTERDLAGLFEQVGRVASIRIMKDRDTGRSKGFGFVEMKAEEADRAITQLNQTDLHDRALSVSMARPHLEPSADRGAPPSRLFVGNLPYEATAVELQEFFSSVGPVSLVSLPVDRESGKPRGFAFVDFPDPAHATEAIRRFHNQSFHGRMLAVSMARARENRPSPSPPARPSQPQTKNQAVPLLDEQPARKKSRRSRQFGSDATPQRNHKPPSRGPKPERGRGKPIQERRSGQFFGAGDDGSYDEVFTNEPDADQWSEQEGGEQL